MNSPKILVVGGSGYFGRILTEELFRYTDCNVIIAGRNQARLMEACHSFGDFSQRLSTKFVDLGRHETIDAALDQVQIAICAAGPFQNFPFSMAELCLKRHVHYIDFSDDRSFVARVRQLVLNHPDCNVLPAVCPGWSAVPALSGLLSRIAADGLDQVESIDIQIAPGNRCPRNSGTVASLLASVGRPFNIWRGGAWKEVTGWSEPRSFKFPLPIGSREGYLVDVPDHELFPKIFQANRVEFRVGSELALLNGAMSLLAWSARKGLGNNWPAWSFVMQHGAALFGFLGHDWG